MIVQKWVWKTAVFANLTPLFVNGHCPLKVIFLSNFFNSLLCRKLNQTKDAMMLRLILDCNCLQWVHSSIVIKFRQIQNKKTFSWVSKGKRLSTLYMRCCDEPGIIC